LIFVIVKVVLDVAVAVILVVVANDVIVVRVVVLVTDTEVRVTLVIAVVLIIVVVLVPEEEVSAPLVADCVMLVDTTARERASGDLPELLLVHEDVSLVLVSLTSAAFTAVTSTRPQTPASTTIWVI
jgi:hypothetical protein